MRIVLSARTYDTAGVVELNVLDSESNFGDFTRRVNRVATLDGGVVINDGGFSYGDRTVELVWQALEYSKELAAQRLIRLYPLVNVFLPDGAYSAAPENYQTDKQQSSLTLLVQSKLSE